MGIKTDKKLYELATALDKPLYIVGGLVRNFLICGKSIGDFDICSAVPPAKVAEKATALGFSVRALFKHTGTVVLAYNGVEYEYTAFRKETYLAGGEHVPLYTEPTDNIVEDAKRRDFKCNAVYYDIKENEIVDPLNGMDDIKNKRLTCADAPSKTFASDGLRLMRLARFTGELGFAPTEETLVQAEKYADNIKDIAPERIFVELKMILVSDTKYDFSSKIGHYDGLCTLERTRVLDRIFPELAIGRGMFQRADFHKYDVLTHTLKTVLYSDKEVRLGALLHDVGKPYCMKNFGRYARHAEYGEGIAIEILKRLKADSDTIRQVLFLVRNHMHDVEDDLSENKVRKIIADNFDFMPELLKLKQADYSAGMDDTNEAKTVVKWRNVYEKMKTDGTPVSVNDLRITSQDIIDIGFYGANIGAEKIRLRGVCVDNPTLNERDKLLELAQRDFEKMKSQG